MSLLVRYLADERPAWHTLAFDYLDFGQNSAQLLESALRACGYSVHRHHQYENWFIRTVGCDFARYFAERPSRMRNTVERKERKLRKSHDVEICVYIENGADLERGIRDYNAVYESSWKRPEPFPEFMPAFARTCASLGALRLGVLYVGGQPTAAQFWIVSGGMACIYKLAYDEEFSEASVGSILSRHMFRLALDVDRVAEVDYGVGSEGYKKDWMNSVRSVDGLRAYAPGTLCGLFRIGKVHARDIIRRIKLR